MPASYDRAATATERAVHDAHERLAEVRVDGAVEDEVQREVDGLERVGDGHGEVVRVDVERIADGHLANEVHHFGRNDQREVHGHDDDQRQRDPVGGATVASASRAPPRATSSRLGAHAQRAAQFDDEVDVAVYEENERGHGADEEVRPVIDALEGRVNC